jgi:hypothetical protein
MKLIFTILGALTLLGCTSVSDLRKPSTAQYFVLTEDYVRVQGHL